MADFVSASTSTEALLNQGFVVYAVWNTIICPINFGALVCDALTHEEKTPAPPKRQRAQGLARCRYVLRFSI